MQTEDERKVNYTVIQARPIPMMKPRDQVVKNELHIFDDYHDSDKKRAAYIICITSQFQ